MQSWAMPPYGYVRQRRGDWLFCGMARNTTTVLDLAAWPPRHVFLPDEFICSADQLPDGRWVVCSSVFDETGTQLRVRCHEAGDPGRRGPPLEVNWNGQPYSPSSVHVVAGQILLVSPFASGQPEGKPLELRRTDLVLRDELPSAEYTHGHQGQGHGTLRLADGREVFFWEGNGYEEVDGRFECAWPLNARPSHLDWTAVAWGDGFFYLSDRRVFHVLRGQRPKRALPDAENIMYLYPGPSGTVLLCHGRNDKGLVVRVWFPAEGSYIAIKRKDLGCKPQSLPGPLFWSERTRQLYFLHGPLWTIPEEEVLGWKHVRPKDRGPLFPL